MYKFDKYDFGKKLKTFRKSQGLTQNEFADKLGIERSNISRYENGDTLPSIEIFLEILILKILLNILMKKKKIILKILLTVILYMFIILAVVTEAEKQSFVLI